MREREIDRKREGERKRMEKILVTWKVNIKYIL